MSRSKQLSCFVIQLCYKLFDQIKIKNVYFIDLCVLKLFLNFAYKISTLLQTETC